MATPIPARNVSDVLEYRHRDAWTGGGAKPAPEVRRRDAATPAGPARTAKYIHRRSARESRGLRRRIHKRRQANPHAAGVSLARGIWHQNHGRRSGAVPANQYGNDSNQSNASARRLRHARCLFHRGCTHPGSDMGAIPLSRRAEDAARRKRAGDAVRRSASHGTDPTAGASGGCVAQQDRLDEWLFGVRGIRSAEEARRRPPVQQKLPDR